MPLPKFSLEDELIDVFSVNKYNRLYVKGTVINEDNKWRLASGWILMATLVSSINYAADGKTYVLDVPFIYENRLVYSVWVSPSVENFFGALCNMEKTVENACLQLLGFSQKDVENILKKIIAENEKIINVARKIALNPIHLCDFWSIAKRSAMIRILKGNCVHINYTKNFLKMYNPFCWTRNWKW
ncbi:MAG: hypothetical protein V8Q93_03235 [Blautia faecis]